jgi:hypothetical protein
MSTLGKFAILNDFHFNSGFHFTFCGSGERKDPYYLFNLELVEMMGESRVFMYPELLPKLAIHQTEPGILLLNVIPRLSFHLLFISLLFQGTDLRFSPYEDQLIAMGIEQFTPFCTNLSNDWWYPLDFLVSSMISKHMLPQWSAEQIQIRIMNNCLDTSPANPIKVSSTLSSYLNSRVIFSLMISTIFSYDSITRRIEWLQLLNTLSVHFILPVNCGMSRRRCCRTIGENCLSKVQ